ncbi:MAG: hypothetical protein CL832_03190 [Crocinitomicaceae bacterium]|nr:hypothetical protein [Crocinitomicaceae bacterium]
MNKLFHLIFLLLPVLFFGQSNNNDPVVESTEFRKFRFGLYGQGSLGWVTPEQKKVYSRGSLGFGYGWGFDLEFNFNKNTSLRSGLNISTYKAGLNYYDSELNENLDETYFSLDQNENFRSWDIHEFPPDSVLYQLYSRNYTINYVNIPVILKFKTNEIGYFTYFGEFGGTLGFKTNASVDDKIKPFRYDTSNSNFSNILPNQNQKFTITDINLDKGTQTVRLGINMGIGAEYNLSGNTALIFQLNWNYFINNLLTKSENENFLRKQTDDGTFETVAVKAIPGNLVLSVGVIF